MSRYKDLWREWKARVRHFRIPQVLTLDFYWKIVVFPVHWFVQNWQYQRLRDLLLGLPALVGIILIPVCFVNFQAQENSLSATYFGEARGALARQKYALGELLLTRVLHRGKDLVLNEARFLMAGLMEETDRKERATELFRMLAPDDSLGNPAAHQRMAILLANTITPQSDPLEIKRLRWHLASAKKDESPELSMAWGRYALAMQDLKAAQKYFQKAAYNFPELWQILGAIETQTGQISTAVTSYTKSAVYLQKQLDDAPNDDKIRINYAEILIKLGRLDEARVALEQGRIENPDGAWAWHLASLTVNYHDIQSTQNTPLSVLLAYLDRALKYEPNHGPALNRLMAYATASVDGNIELRTVLARVIAEGEQPALAHLAMGNLCWIEADQKGALFHFESAIAIRDDYVVVLNNLAWIISHQADQPDFERALALVNVALEKQPNNFSFLDTRGTILFLQKNWAAALTDLEKAMSGVRDKNAVHEKLAVIYHELGMQEISDQHTMLSKELKNKTAPMIPQAR